MSKDDQDEVHSWLGGGYVAYQPMLAPVFGVNATLMLCQLIYWNGLGSRQDGWFYKTRAEMQAETGLSRTQQDNAIRKLKKLGIIDVDRKGIPAKRHFFVHLDKLQSCLFEYYKLEDMESGVYIEL